MNFRIKLIELRKAKGYTQEELSSRCNVSARTIQRIESGLVQPRAHTIRVISETLDFDFFNSTEIRQDNSFSWYIKDLFNLKTQKMKKISILGLLTIVILMGAFQFISELSINSKATKSGLTISVNHDGSTKRIDAVFSNKLTLDSLVSIKSVLSEYGITLKYEAMRFDLDGGLTQIECKVNCNDGMSGSFSSKSLTAKEWTGFYRDYSKKAKAAFCAGPCSESY